MHQRHTVYPFTSIDAIINAGSDADAQCGQGLKDISSYLICFASCLFSPVGFIALISAIQQPFVLQNFQAR